MEILASLDDINANLPSLDDNPVIEATDENTALLQVSIARVVRGYLARAISNTILMGWSEPVATPDIVREAAAKLIAAQLYFNYVARTSLELPDRSFAQRMYDEAIALLKGILDGSIILEGVVLEASEGMTLLDGFPVDSTDRAFTLSMEL